ncbi:YegS/Rv2252/BmrU family lipid kinase [Geosporobacter ferrireducens]|uniref:Transcriptional regulator n=1 Tax=Geosporobacter ferrireducens TaxID=1424294 RepID=A0A1D8GJJ9_9FIRM|nr:YegS/Rv2252/BmrU family lipid kinase [Geosporobacter ferrireducens]AOT71095.1 transcriptional regulator [Geosporobacter ferrireducens]MTI57899.1 YegS/Rv2252/BmrU family lipid kinase [Geosporobacter ferrireducens]
MKVKLIYNPVSGHGRFKNHLDYIIEKFQEAGLQIEPFRTGKKEELDKMISLMNEKEYSKVLVAGGDGTINQVVNCLLKYNITLPLGIFPVGTANDYAQYFNLPHEIEEIVEILLGDHYTLSDIGLVNERYFINVASLGVLIDISQRTNTELKNSLGVLAYYLNGIGELSKIKPVQIRVNSEMLNYDGEILFMLIMNGKSAGGFNKIAPCASINDGLLDIFIFKKCPIYELAPLLLAVINGEHINNLNVIHFKTKELTVDTKNDVGTDLDGEEGPLFPLKVTVIPKKLKIIT